MRQSSRRDEFDSICKYSNACRRVHAQIPLDEQQRRCSLDGVERIGVLGRAGKHFGNDLPHEPQDGSG